MKKVFLFLAMALVSVFAMAQTSHYNQVVWLNGKMMYANPIPAIDSITYTDEATEQDTLHLLLPRTIVRIQHDTVYETKTVYKHDTVYINTCEEGNNKAIGKFSVSADKQVAFSQGNLQYTQSTNTWSFAKHQYDVIGTANASGSALADRIDMFGWSATNTTAPFGVSTSTSIADYSGDFVDWGSNTIGNDAPNAWRTLTIDEWRYLCYTRANADNLIGVARLNISADGSEYVNGLIFLPDTWVCPAGVAFKSGFATEYSEQAFADYQTISLSDWQQMEASGAVFLPCAGYRGGSIVYDVGSNGYYWSATPYDSDDARVLGFDSDDARTYYYWYRYYGRSVRLVQDLK